MTCPGCGEQIVAPEDVPDQMCDECRCPVCKGHGDIWVGWHPTPVQCGHCHGTGKRGEDAG